MLTGVVLFFRKDWSILRPLVSSDQEYLDDLASCGVFIAGTTDPTLSTAASTLFDVVFSVLDRRVIVAESVAADMRMGSVHRDISQVGHLASMLLALIDIVDID